MNNEISNITNPQVVSYFNSFYKAATPQLAELRREAEADRIPVILRETETFLAALLRIARPARILEFGTAVGYSSSFFASVCGPQTDILTLEADENMADRARASIAKLGYQDQITVITGDARVTAPPLPGNFDFVFIDAAKSHYREYLDAVISKMHTGSVVVSDNILMKGRTASDQYDPGHKYRTSIRRMREFLQYITESEDFTTSLISAGDGLAVSVAGQINGEARLDLK